MRSKTFFSDYFKQQFKKQLWFMGILAFALFLILPVSILIDVENMDQASYLFMEKQRILMLHPLRSDLLYLCTLLGGVLAAVFQFRYLHSGKMVDFYHSLPIRKEKMYFMKLLTVYLDFVIPYTIMLLFSLILVLIRGLLTGKAVIAWLFAWILYQIMYLMVYALSSVAMLLTGRIFVGIMGIGVFLFIPAVIDGVFDSYKSSFLYTYYGGFHQIDLLEQLSPGILPLEIRNVFSNMCQKGFSFTSDSVFLMTCLILFLAVFLEVGYYLMKIRPSEAAGSSMVFSVPGRVIHVVLCIVGALFCGLFVDNMMYNQSMLWLSVGVLSGGFLLYILIQFIYTMDFRKIFRYKWQLILVEVISIGIAGLYYYDWMGYDTYIPEYESLYSVALSIPDGYHYEYYYIDDVYVDADEYRLQSMNLTVTEDLYEMLKDAINSTQKKDAPYDGGINYMYVRYKLKNGRERNREYRLDLKKYKELFASYYDQAEFKKIMMPVYALWMENGEYSITLEYENQYTELFGKDTEKAREFVKVLKNDYDQLNGNVFINEIPIGTLNIFAKHLSRNYYVYIYPSNTETIRFLKESGYTMESSLVTEKILKIEVEDYRLPKEEQQESERENAIEIKEMASAVTLSPDEFVTYTDPEQISQILPALVDDNMNILWSDLCDNLYATVTYVGHDGYQQQMRCSFLEDELPEFLELD